MGRFETQWLAAPANLPALSDLSGQWIDIVHGRPPPKGIVLDMDSSVSPTHGEQEDSVWNGHYACTCYHPLFVFNQFGDLERCTLRPGNVHSADGWVSVLKPVIVRYQGKVLRIYFRADAAFAMPGVYECLEAERIKYAIRLPANHVLQKAVLRQFHLPGGKLDQAAPGDCQGRVAPGRALSARRLHRDEHEPTGRAGGRLLQQARHVRAMDQGRQRCDQVDAAVVPDVRRQRGPAPASCARLQSWQLSPHTCNTGADQGLVADELEGEADQDRREGGEPRTLCRLPNGGGRHPTTNVPGDSAADRGTTAAATARASMKRSIVTRSRANQQEECVQMPLKIARSAARPSFGLPELLVAIHTSRQSCSKAAKARIFALVWESSGESQIKKIFSRLSVT